MNAPDPNSPDPQSVLTPDFYHYQWDPLISAAISGEMVELGWADGGRLHAHGWWLRESIVDDGATDPTTREGTLDPADFPDDLVVTSASVNLDGALRLEFNDGFGGTVHPGWLRHVADARHQPASHLPANTVWTAASLEAPPTFDGAKILDGDDRELLTFLGAMVEFGLARLVDVPTDLGADTEGLARIAGRIGVCRDTNFGRLWNVKAEIGGNFENSTANTGLRLGPHTDLPTRETPPGFQLLHCVANSVSGGWSRMTDGAALTAHLEENEPATYEALTTLPWVFFNRSREHDHRWTGPMIDLGAPGSPLTIRAFYPVRAFPAMEAEDVGRAYRAAKRFHQLGADPRFQIGYPFEPGHLVGFDNRRLLHGRDGFDAGAGFRHLRGTYIDHDEVYSRLRVLARQRYRSDRTPEAPPNLNSR